MDTENQYNASGQVVLTSCRNCDDGAGLYDAVECADCGRVGTWPIKRRGHIFDRTGASWTWRITDDGQFWARNEQSVNWLITMDAITPYGKMAADRLPVEVLKFGLSKVGGLDNAPGVTHDD